MNDAKPHVLVIGCGSIGERHIRTFLATGRVRVTGCDPRPEIQSHIAATYCVPTVGDAREVETNRDISAVVVATPASSHIPLAIAALAQGRHVLIEKPLAVALAGVDELVAARDVAKKFASVAYVCHYQPGLHAAREFLRLGSFGRVRHAAVNTGHDFPDARPAYRKIYYRDHAQGGGAIQDALTHMANAVEWILGPTESVYCDASHQVLEGVDVEDTVNLAARNGGALVTYSLNQFQAPNETRFDFHAEHGTVRVELHTQRWGTFARGAKDWTWTSAPVLDRDQLFVAQANAFLDGCEGRPNPICTLEEGIQTLRFNLAALRSWRENCPVTP